MIGLNDGTPGCDGVLVEGRYDARFDIESEQFEPFGYIYLLTNKINGKVYVGQTSKTVKIRWYDHVAHANSYFKGNKPYIPVIDMAIAKYGKENFELEEIECCLMEVIDKRELHWIKKYDCCILDGKDKGYNVSRGGKGYRHYILDEKEIINLYLNGTSLIQLGKLYSASSDTIKSILIKNKVKLRNEAENKIRQRKSFGQKVKQLDYKGNVLREFDSQGDAADWMIEHKLAFVSSKAVRTVIRSSFLKHHRAYGFWWIIEGINEELVKEQLEKIAISKNIPPKPRSTTKKKKKKTCAILNCSNAPFKYSKYCEEHAYKSRNSHEPDDILEVVRLVCETSFVEAGKRYGVTDNAVRNWLKKHDLPYSAKELLKYAIDNNLIDDPIDKLPHNEICQRFKKHGGLQRTGKAFHCSENAVIQCCLKHGMTLEEIHSTNKKATERNTQKRVAYCDDSGNEIKSFDSVGEASRQTGIARIHITEECKGNRKTRWNWKFLN